MFDLKDLSGLPGFMKKLEAYEGQLNMQTVADLDAQGLYLVIIQKRTSAQMAEQSAACLNRVIVCDHAPEPIMQQRLAKKPTSETDLEFYTLSKDDFLPYFKIVKGQTGAKVFSYASSPSTPGGSPKTPNPENSNQETTAFKPLADQNSPTDKTREFISIGKAKKGIPYYAIPMHFHTTSNKDVKAQRKGCQFDILDSKTKQSIGYGLLKDGSITVYPKTTFNYVSHTGRNVTTNVPADEPSMVLSVDKSSKTSMQRVALPEIQGKDLVPADYVVPVTETPNKASNTYPTPTTSVRVQCTASPGSRR